MKGSGLTDLGKGDVRTYSNGPRERVAQKRRPFIIVEQNSYLSCKIGEGELTWIASKYCRDVSIPLQDCSGCSREPCLQAFHKIYDSSQAF